MITEIKLKNFKCFPDHTVPFKPNTIIVGENNAGKSTIIEALRILSVVISKYENINYTDIPKWLEDKPDWYRGVVPSLKDYDLYFDDSIFYQYKSPPEYPPAEIKVFFDNGCAVEIYIGGEGKIYCVIFNNKGNIIKNKREAKNLALPKVLILPQITPLLKEETLLSRDHVVKHISTRLSSRHFRNQLALYPERYERFKSLVEQTWSGAGISSFTKPALGSEEEISLLVRDGDFVAEVGHMGHGFQMWIQIMWFLTATEKNAVIILDEPDVYMHADLQRKLIRLLFDQNYRQTVVATHSLEIISESEPQNILVIDRKKPKSKFLNSIPGVQEIIDRIGCVHNIQLTRFWACKKCIFVEGDDPSILKHLYRKISSDSEPFDLIPNIPINGWSGWNNAIVASKMLKNESNEKITTYCFLDRDYHTQEVIQSRLEDAKKRKVELHIWSKKELENYLLSPVAIARIINSESRCEKVVISDSEISEQLNIIAEELKDETSDSFLTEFHLQDKSHGPAKASQKARELVISKWNSLENKLSIVSGKSVISKLSKWSQDNYKVSFSPERIAKELNKDEIPHEMISVLKSIEQNKPFESL